MEVADVDAANSNGSALHVVEAEEQVGQGGLAGSGVSDHGDGLAGGNAETDIAQNPVLADVSEPDMVEFDSNGALRKRLRAGRRDDGWLGVEQFENTLGGGHRTLEDIVFFAEVLDGPEEAQSILKKRDQHAEGQGALPDAEAAVGKQQR